jgi:formylglycine-generating enzyme required for sulfatase activity
MSGSTIPTIPAATRIFVSHSTQDNEWCRPLVAALTAAHLDVWYDERGLSGGAEWVQTLQREVQARDVLLLVLTPEAWSSQWVQEEIQLAIATRRTILPVLHKPTPVEGFLLTRQWVDVIGLDAATAARRVLAALASPVVFPAAPKPKTVLAAPQLLTPRLHQLGFIGRMIDGVAVVTPPICPVPAGPFLTGSHPARDSRADEDDGPLRPLEIGAFRIARFPVTVAEYACAVAAQGVPQPGEWSRQRQRLEHPVVQVSWKHAQAYVKWLADVTGEPWRLPTEREWEKAARGTDGRVYPWGDRWEASRANTSDGGPGDTTPVGSYPQGMSPYGAFEMAGSVNEWCGVPSNSPLARADSGSGGTLKGGSWDDSPACARAIYSAQLYIGERTDSTGFRLVWQEAQ